MIKLKISHGDGHALAVDPDLKEANLRRIRRIAGQVRGIEKMISDEKYCADILVQVSAVQEALRSLGRELMRNHLKHCASAAIRDGDVALANQMYEELLDLMYKYSR